MLAIISTVTLALVGFVFWYAYPVITFGGRYRHRDGNLVCVYEFRDGRFHENGKDLGRFSVHLRTVTIHLDIEHANEPIHAIIGWNTISMPISKYGQSVLTKQDPA